MTEATSKQRNPCQVRRKTDWPCPYQAVVEICGIPFCAACARRQEAYFAIGELTQEAQGLRSGPLVGALESIRRGRKTGGIAVAEELEASSTQTIERPSLIEDDGR